MGLRGKGKLKKGSCVILWDREEAKKAGNRGEKVKNEGG